MAEAARTARYGADLFRDGMLHLKVVRSPHTHARILEVDAADQAHSSVGGRREVRIACDRLGALGAPPGAPRAIDPDPGHERDQQEGQGERGQHQPEVVFVGEDLGTSWR